MIDIHQLPIPDWGLRCPHCAAPLAGLEAYCCRQCGQRFNILQVLGQHRPIPDIGLTCPQCDYLLTGLMNQRCPECGTEFRVREMLEDTSPLGTVAPSTLAEPPDHHIKKREPTYTGFERPLPDFGLYCSDCDRPLAGANDDTCPHCQHPFDLLALMRGRDWVDISPYVPKEMRMLTNATLYGAQVPYLIDNAGLRTAYGADLPFVSRRLRVPREFFWDALAALASVSFDKATGPPGEWQCPTCGEAVPADFDICWNCNGRQPSDECSS
jgi:hypothetical protein